MLRDVSSLSEKPVEYLGSSLDIYKTLLTTGLFAKLL